MNVIKGLREIESDLPNGFHDALLETVTVSFASKSVRLDMQLFVGNPEAETKEEREAYKRAKLCLSDLVYFVIDPPTPGQEYSAAQGLRIDGGDATGDSGPKPRGALPTGAFAYWFFVDQWNSFIHVAAWSATLQWV
jgi:hypothetical protein